MCYFTTVAVFDAAADDFIAMVPRGLKAYPLRNRSITQQIPKDLTELVLTSGMCSCDLFSTGHSDPSHAQRLEHLQKKYAKRNWSDAKVKRAIESSLASYAPQSKKAGYDERVRNLVADFVELYGKLEIVSHFYDGDIETEQFTLKRAQTLSPLHFREGSVEIDDDELITVSQKQSPNDERRPILDNY